MLGTKYLVLIMIVSPFPISRFDRVQTTIFEDVFVCVIGSTENDNRHTIISFRILWWGVLGPGDLRSAETLDRQFGEFGHSKKVLVIPRTFWALGPWP